MIHYRTIEDSDIETLFDIRIKTWHNPRGAKELEAFGITPESVQKQLHTSHHGWLGFHDERPIGFAMGDRTRGEMWVIAVLQEYEGQGIGSELLVRVEEWLFENGWEQIWLTTDPDEHFRAVQFYKAKGWQDWKFENGDRYMKKDRSADSTTE